jgi:hypothetical protein
MTHVVIGISGSIEFCNLITAVGTFRFDPEKKASKKVDKEKGDKRKPKYLEHCRSQVDYSNVLHGSEAIKAAIRGLDC